MACSCGEDEAPLSQAWRARVRGGGHQSRAQRTLPHVQAAVNGRNSNFVLFLSAPSQSALPGTANLLFLELFLSGLAASGPGIVGIANKGISGAIPMTSAPLFGLKPSLKFQKNLNFPPKSIESDLSTPQKVILETAGCEVHVF